MAVVASAFCGRGRPLPSGGPPACEGGPPACEGGPPACDGGPPACEGGPPACEGRVPSAGIAVVGSLPGCGRGCCRGRWSGIARVASAEGCEGGGVVCPPAGAVPRNSPSHDSISRSSRGAAGGGGAGRWVRCVSPAGGWLIRAVALFTALRTAFLAIDSRVVCGSSDCGRAVGIRVVPAPDGTLARGGVEIR